MNIAKQKDLLEMLYARKRKGIREDIAQLSSGNNQ